MECTLCTVDMYKNTTDGRRCAPCMPGETTDGKVGSIQCGGVYINVKDLNVV